MNVRTLRVALGALALTLSWLAQLHQAVAADGSKECAGCVQRKQKICADECEEVPSQKFQHCHSRCVKEYCAHQCTADAAELEKPPLSCDDCLDHQFNTCESHCGEGAPRVRAICQLSCASERCTASCPAQTKSSKNTSTP